MFGFKITCNNGVEISVEKGVKIRGQKGIVGALEIVESFISEFPRLMWIEVLVNEKMEI